jgi:hypothetical protein
MGACSASGAGYRAADAVRRLRRAGSWRGRLRNLLGKIVVHCATVYPRLGIPFVYDPGPGLLSMEVIADPPAYARARAAVRCDDVARTLVHALKYRDRTDLAPAMGRWMAPAGQELLGEADALVPVPHALAARLEPPLLSFDFTYKYAKLHTLLHTYPSRAWAGKVCPNHLAFGRVLWIRCRQFYRSAPLETPRVLGASAGVASSLARGVQVRKTPPAMPPPRHGIKANARVRHGFSN